LKYDLFSPNFKANPYPTYAALRDHAPRHCRAAVDGKAALWFITRYDDVAALLRDHKRFVKNVTNTLSPAQQAHLPPTPPLLRLLGNHMLNLDPPDHTRLRALVNKAFTAQIVTQLHTRIQQVADELLDRVHRQGAMDLIEDFAFPLPMIVIAELLGIPPKDRLRFRHWSTAFVTPSTNLERNANKMVKAGQVMEDFTRYMRQVFAARRREPRNDLISHLLQAEENGDTLSEDELFSMMILLIVAGHETTVNLIGNGLLALLQHPDQRALLQAQPARLPATQRYPALYLATPVEQLKWRRVPILRGLHHLPVEWR